MNEENEMSYIGKTHPIGSIFKLEDGTKLKVVLSNFCDGCFFENLCLSCDYISTDEAGECAAAFRSDGHSVKFIRVRNKQKSHKVTKSQSHFL